MLKEINQKLNGLEDAEFTLIPSLKEQNAGTLKRLREFADNKYNNQAARERPENGDFKIDMTKDDLK